MKAITENQLHDFLINSRYYTIFTQYSTLLGFTITVDPQIKFGLRKVDCFIKKLSTGLFRLLVLFTKKYQKPDVGSCQSTKIDTFLGQIPKTFDPHLLPDFPGDPNFLKEFDNMC